MQETVVAEGNLQDVTNLVASMHRNREPLIHTAVYIEIMSHDIDMLKELQTEVLTELKTQCGQADAQTAAGVCFGNAERI